MPQKPSYIALLNAIALAEGNAHKYLSAWANTTNNPEVEKVVRTIALREAEHSLAFEKRLCELGYAVTDQPDPELGNEVFSAAATNLQAKMKMFSSDASDLEKFEYLGYKPGECPPDPFGKLFEDTTIDIQTGTLLGRYIAEERDSGRMLEACYQELCRSAGRSPSARETEVSLADVCAEIGELKACIAELQESVAGLIGGTKRKNGRLAEAQH